jgi:hypothetical protein
MICPLPFSSRNDVKSQESFDLTSKVTIKLSHCRPGEAAGLQGVEAPRISRQTAHESGKFVSPTYRPPLPLPRRYPLYSFLLEAESNPGP